MSDKTMVVFHGGCTDGCAAAWAVWKKHPGWTFVPGFYQTAPPGLAGFDEVYLVDFSYKRPAVEKMLEQARVTLIDHHKTAIEDLAPLADDSRFSSYTALDRCGAMLAWEYFHDGPPPKLMKHVNARDLGLEDLPHQNDEVILALRSYPHSPEAAGGTTKLLYEWDWLMSRGVDLLSSEGTHILRYYRVVVDDVKRSARVLSVGNRSMLVANCTYHFASEVARELARDSETGMAACWYIQADGRVYFSVRSRGEVDAGAWCAEHFGGGGHPKAAGFVAPRDHEGISEVLG